MNVQAPLSFTSGHLGSAPYEICYEHAHMSQPYAGQVAEWIGSVTQRYRRNHGPAEQQGYNRTSIKTVVSLLNYALVREVILPFPLLRSREMRMVVGMCGCSQLSHIHSLSRLQQTVRSQQTSVIAAFSPRCVLPVREVCGGLQVVFVSRSCRVWALVLRSDDCISLSVQTLAFPLCPVMYSPLGTMMTISKIMMPTMMQMRIFISFHHICLRTLLAPRRKPCADVARLSVLSCRLSSRSPRSPAF